MERKAELLAPAGSYETMMAAFHAGADAVYIGGQAFGARAYADNPDEEMLRRAIRYAHIHGKKLYLTVNTLVKEDELEKRLIPYLRPYYEEGLDAVIVQDLGVLRLIRRVFPGLAVHASTQMTMSGVCSAKKLEKLGVSRIVTPRELSLEELREIHQTTSLEIESFVHGALCYCYSGQCLFSSLAGGRSGNRGRCAQPCRLPYRLLRNSELAAAESQGYLLSPKDLCTVGSLPRILEAGVYSLKIEGRMKRPEYTAGVVSVYRRYLDRWLKTGESYRVSKADERELFDLFNRKGFTDGYYFRHNGAAMITKEKPSVRKEPQELYRKVRESYIDSNLKENINGLVKIFAGEPVIIEASLRGCCARVLGEPALQAQNRPLLEADIRRSMEKIRDTEFSWDTLDIETDGQSFYPVGKLNELRRQALEMLEQELAGAYRRKWQENTAADGEKAAVKAETGCGQNNQLLFTASAETADQLDAILACRWIGRVYVDSHLAYGDALVHAAERVKAAGKECFLQLPRMVRQEMELQLRKDVQVWKQIGFDGYLTASAEGLLFLKQELGNVRIIGDHSLYAWNRAAVSEWKDWGLTGLTAPAELNAQELKRLGLDGMELIVYGYQPMMISAQCLQNTALGCVKKQNDRPGTLELVDRLGNHFPFSRYCRECCSVIWNAAPLSLADVWERVQKLEPESVRLAFSIESANETKHVLDLFARVQAGERQTGNLPVYTRGHWKRGVE